MRWPIGQSLEFLARLGVGAVSLTMARLGDPPDEAIALVRGSGMQVASIGTGGACLIDDAQSTLAHLRPLIDVAASLGCRSAFSVSGPAPERMPTDEAFDRLVAMLGLASSYAIQSGVRLVIEHSSITNRELGFVGSLHAACELGRRADLGVVVELQNCWYERDLPRLFRENHDRFLIVNVSDFRTGEELKFNRRVPGDGSIPLEWLIGELLDAGYTGYFDLEFLGPAIEAEGYESAISRGVEWISERLTRWGV
ncbi:sugar phosphate isomerase/epimerase family protein [Novosphingobium album (ex Hu et al. 2023)]|uniref:Sugar phosphate isomerase/epimerase n=1 Tax=Novosphingobium album (ex Hu et al. 2023) TaxID=2930093 RepID=A0ABT0AW63_9SPHN|nr:sugar phosphate isomerase/epimerase family protein [Novosphingobium album (ex Hu et al. 2023)]MCJ2177067.1 sugar phosphate isomerase/epimerase [Novosphingobium album (ex Hu et al. 2023)]